MLKRIELAKMFKNQRECKGLALEVLSEKSGVCVSHKRLLSASGTGKDRLSKKGPKLCLFPGEIIVDQNSSKTRNIFLGGLK